MTWTAMEHLVGILYCVRMIPPVIIVYTMNGMENLSCGWIFVGLAGSCFITSLVDFTWEASTFEGKNDNRRKKAMDKMIMNLTKEMITELYFKNCSIDKHVVVLL